MEFNKLLQNFSGPRSKQPANRQPLPRKFRHIRGIENLALKTGEFRPAQNCVSGSSHTGAAIPYLILAGYGASF